MLNIVSSGDTNKKYRIGYLSGTFDLFHIGHINMLRRAKEQCEYLIAAVTSDEYVRIHKDKEPIIPFEERVEVLKACKYVDEVVGVPVNYAGTVEAFQKYHFDCQFCGSDYANDAWWLQQKKFLQSHGSDLVFFSYTEQTSSTKIRSLIDKGLL
ncbi:MAG: adenylyltransferase/cytidyltransferase family protein [Lachnospiraceae bacterium]|nr:adenylyltransferase/cytidyltransferase family protein [Lachnospiraceae bacterium]